MWDESIRVAALQRYELLDSEVDDDFADFVSIASDICNTPIASINLIDSARHWTLMGIGHGERELSLDRSICAQTIRQNDVFVIPDLSFDERFRDNPLVIGGPKLRFYAGAVLETPDGMPVGTICVLDSKPRPEGLTERQRFTLKALARQVVTQFELRRATRDISDGNAARGRLQASLNEKDALLKEVHHRVKNNLQLVSSLLNLQASRISDPATASLFVDSRNRVRSMALVHENLYRAGSFAGIAIRPHILSLCSHLRRAYAANGIEIVAESDDITLDLDRAISCGLVINELVSNAFKHAFTGAASGLIEVSFRRQSSGRCELTVSDNGIGMFGRIDIVDAMSLGLQLVRDLVEQLGGRITIERDSGTRCVVSFDDAERAAV
jgi:two-component sensor histidine kinase